MWKWVKKNIRRERAAFPSAWSVNDLRTPDTIGFCVSEWWKGCKIWRKLPPASFRRRGQLWWRPTGSVPCTACRRAWRTLGMTRHYSFQLHSPSETWRQRRVRLQWNSYAVDHGGAHRMLFSVLVGAWICFLGVLHKDLLATSLANLQLLRLESVFHFCSRKKKCMEHLCNCWVTSNCLTCFL